MTSSVLSNIAKNRYNGGEWSNMQTKLEDGIDTTND